MKQVPETGFLLSFSPEIGFIQETRFFCTSLTWKVLYIKFGELALIVLNLAFNPVAKRFNQL